MLLEPVPTYGVELLFADSPQVSKKQLFESLLKHCGQVEPLGDLEQSNVLAFVHPEHTLKFADGKVLPVQSFMAISETPIDPDKVQHALEQTWDWSEAQGLWHDIMPQCY